MAVNLVFNAPVRYDSNVFLWREGLQEPSAKIGNRKRTWFQLLFYCRDVFSIPSSDIAPEKPRSRKVLGGERLELPTPSV